MYLTGCGIGFHEATSPPGGRVAKSLWNYGLLRARRPQKSCGVERFGQVDAARVLQSRRDRSRLNGPYPISSSRKPLLQNLLKMRSRPVQKVPGRGGYRVWGR
jgi:hypothetical protein